MKEFWEDMFYDLKNSCEDEVADCWGTNIRIDFERIEDAIRSYDLIKALAIIKECKGYY